MWIADGMIATPLASLIASGFALIGFALGCALTEDKWRRRLTKKGTLRKDGPKPA